jgi:hypothetical protein
MGLDVGRALEITACHITLRHPCPLQSSTTAQAISRLIDGYDLRRRRSLISLV